MNRSGWLVKTNATEPGRTKPAFVAAVGYDLGATAFQALPTPSPTSSESTGTKPPQPFEQKENKP